MKVCKDGRIWGQNNKEASTHLGILTGRKNIYISRLHDKNWVDKRKNPDRAKHFLKYNYGHIPWNKGNGNYISGEKHPNWKGGISKTVEWRRERNRAYWEKNKEKFRMKAKLRKAKIRGLGIITRETLQRIYEENIKKHGTLTCYLCLKSIQFGNDHLEHKHPISRGGNNDFINLGVSCSKCNLSKHNKTEAEFLRKVGDLNVRQSHATSQPKP